MEALLGNLTSILSNISLPAPCSKAKDYQVVERTFYGVLLPFVCILGTFCNVIVIIILNTPDRFNTSTHVFCKFLAFFQGMSLLTYFIDYIDGVFIKDNLTSSLVTAYIDWPISAFCTALSLLFVLVVIIDRFWCLCKPVVIEKAVKQRAFMAKIASLLLCFVAACLNSPRMFAFTVDMETGCRTTRWLQDDGAWFVGYSYTRLVVYHFGSVFALIVFYILLVYRLKMYTKFHIQYAIAALCNRRAKQCRIRERNLTLTILVVAFVAMVGEVPSLCLNPLSLVLIWNADASSDRFLEMRRVGKVLMIVEYSSAFFVYYIFYKPFHSAYKRRLRKWGEFCLPKKFQSKSDNKNSPVDTDPDEDLDDNFIPPAPGLPGLGMRRANRRPPPTPSTARKGLQKSGLSSLMVD